MVICLILEGGGHLYDERFERCFQYGCEQVLPMILGRYVDQLQRDLVNQIHFCQNSDDKIYKFLQQELSSRKIVLWIKRNWPMKLVRPQDEAIILAIKDNDIDGIILLAHQREKKLQSYSWKMKLIGFYQKVVDKIGYYY